MELTKFDNNTHNWGKVWTVAALLFMLMVPFAISVHLNAWPKVSVIIAGLAPLLMLYLPSSIVEIMVYTPMMGAGATYLSFVTGNIANVKMPCALAALKASKTKVTSQEGELICTIAVGTSAIVCSIIIAIFVLLLTPVLPYLTAEGSIFKPAFSIVVPALFGAIAMPYLLKTPKYFIAPVIGLGLLVWFMGSLQIGVLIFAGVAISVIAALIMYKTGFVKPEEVEESPTEVPEEPQPEDMPV